MKVKVKAHEITDADISKVSLVKRGANRTPFKIVKAEERLVKTSVDIASEALEATIAKQLAASKDKGEAEMGIMKSVGEFKAYISKMVEELSEKVFKHGLTNPTGGSSLSDNQVLTDGDTNMTKQAILKEAASGDLAGLNDPAQIAKDQAKMAADAARIEKEAADKAAADKAAAEALAKEAADKAAADKAAADAAAAELAKEYKMKKVKKADGKTYEVQYKEVDGVEEIVKETELQAQAPAQEVAKSEADIAALVAKAVAEAIAPLTVQLAEVKKTADKKVVIHKGLNDVDASFATRTPKGKVAKAEVNEDTWGGSALDIFNGFRS